LYQHALSDQAVKYSRDAINPTADSSIMFFVNVVSNYDLQELNFGLYR
jgi:hypothetical protein